MSRFRAAVLVMTCALVCVMISVFGCHHAKREDVSSPEWAARAQRIDTFLEIAPSQSHILVFSDQSQGSMFIEKMRGIAAVCGVADADAAMTGLMLAWASPSQWQLVLEGKLEPTQAKCILASLLGRKPGSNLGRAHVEAWSRGGVRIAPDWGDEVQEPERGDGGRALALRQAFREAALRHQSAFFWETAVDEAAVMTSILFDEACSFTFVHEGEKSYAFQADRVNELREVFDEIDAEVELDARARTVRLELDSWNGKSLMRGWMVEAFRTSLDSMFPALIPGDNMLTFKEGVLFREYRRGDVVLYEVDVEEGLASGDELAASCQGAYGPSSASASSFRAVGRIVAMGGDTIALSGDKALLNGAPLSREVIERREVGGAIPYMMRVKEEAGGGAYEVLSYGVAPEFPEYTVPEGEVFVLIDARDRGWDSRCYGAIPLERVLGRVEAIYLPGERQGVPDWRRLGGLD